MKRFRRSDVAGWGLALLLGWMILYPIGLVMLASVRGPEGWTTSHIERFLAHGTTWSALWGSLWISVATVVVAGLIGVPLAIFFGRFDFPGRRILSGLVALPAVLPPLVGVIAFLFLFGESGFVGQFFKWIFGLDRAPWRLEGAFAVLLVHGYSMYVYYYLLTRAALARLDVSMLEAAASLGAGRWRTFSRVLVPLLKPAILGAALLTFMTSLASFSAPYIFGGGFRVMTTQIVATRLNGDDALAMVQTAALAVLALAGLWAFRGQAGADSLVAQGKGVAPRPRLIANRGARTVTAVAGWLFALVLLLPHLTLLLVSFVPQGTWTTEPIPPEYTVGNYLALLNEPSRFRPLLNSLAMATGATAAAVALSVAAGIVSVRRRARSGPVVEGLLAFPWAVPGTVLAIALATAFSVASPATGRLLLVGTVWILPLAYLVRNLPITSRAILAGFRQFDGSLEEAAASLGAGPWRTTLRVLLPSLRPAIAAGATLAFVTALGDFVTSIVLYTYDTRPISLEILSSLRQADVGVAAAYGVFLMAVSALVFSFSGDRSRAGAT